MGTRSTNIALLFFSRTANAEAAEKPLLKGNNLRLNQLASKILINHSLRHLSSLHLPLFIIDQTKQSGTNFGERLSNAFEEIFKKGYSAVVAVGNDTPEINRIDWQKTIFSLEKGQNVIGPSHRGGAYLIGLTKQSFQAGAFQSLPWQTKNIFCDLRKLASSESPALILPALRDINTIRDLTRFISGSTEDLLKKMIRLFKELFFPGIRPINFFQVFIEETNLVQHGLRAPPVY